MSSPDPDTLRLPGFSTCEPATTTGPMSASWNCSDAGVGVGVGAGPGVFVGVRVGVAVGPPGVFVGAAMGVGVRVGVAVGPGPGVFVGAATGVGVGVELVAAIDTLSNVAVASNQWLWLVMANPTYTVVDIGIDACATSVHAFPSADS
jgi:hypothetical protein